jgi:RNA polymerase sigma-70 factor (ECF subfamily)
MTLGVAMGESDGGRDRLDRLVREHLPAALRFATRLTGCPDDAEELVQDTLVRVAKHWPSFHGGSAFRTWLFRILINVFRDGLEHSRRERDRQATANEGHQADPPDSREAAPDRRLLHAELERVIAGCVSSLPPRQREVLVLTVYEGLSATEAAALLQTSEQNIHATLHLARKRLREELAPYLLEKS